MSISFLTVFLASGCSPSVESETYSAVTRNSDDTWTSDALQNNDVQAICRRAVDEPGYLVARDYLGDTPLLTAISFDNLVLVQFLLEHGADPNVTVDDGYTCLLTAVESDAAVSVRIVVALIAAGADIHQSGTNGWTPLHMAAARGHAEKAQLLIDAGANVNQRTEIDGEETPLMEAAFSGQAETVQVLLGNGADASMRDSIQNRTPLEISQYAAAGPDPGVSKFLKEENIQIDVDELFGNMDLPPDQLAMMKQHLENVDMAENYIQNSKSIVELGNHAKVIRILTEHAAQR